MGRHDLDEFLIPALQNLVNAARLSVLIAIAQHFAIAAQQIVQIAASLLSTGIIFTFAPCAKRR
jgi:hypothetical protein